MKNRLNIVLFITFSLCVGGYFLSVFLHSPRDYEKVTLNSLKSGAEVGLMQGNAGCLIINQKREILMVKGVKTGKYHIPGGTMIQGETAQETAVRETHEEIGIKPSVVRLFKKYTNGFYMFLCRVDESKLDMQYSFESEVAGLTWVDVESVDESLLRYPQEYKNILHEMEI